MFTLDELQEAHGLVQQSLRPTPAFAWPLLTQRLGAEVVVKHENHQPTGAFKVRGGLTYCEALVRREPTVKGIISATRGNHGQKSCFRGATIRSAGDDRRAAWEFAREERLDARPWS